MSERLGGEESPDETEQTDTCTSCGGTTRFIGGRGPYCRSCGWCAERPPRPLRASTDRSEVQEP